MSSTRTRTIAAEAVVAMTRSASSVASRFTCLFSLRSGFLFDAGTDGIDERAHFEGFADDRVKRKIRDFHRFVERGGDDDDLLEECWILCLNLPDEVDAAVGHLQIQKNRIVVIAAQHVVRFESIHG